MKTLLTIVRWVVGLLFIFSGLVKANDPLGLSYKMQEFFEVWGWQSLNGYTLSLAFIMNVFEVLAGVAVIIGWRMKLFSWLLLLLIIFFSFLTGYAMFSGKFKSCGCFGDCLPLTPAQSFTKDIVLLLLIIVLFVNAHKIYSLLKPWLSAMLLLACVVVVIVGQLYVLQHLPFVDCLPYKKGNNILEQMKKPAGAVSDSTVIIFQYKKDGKQVEFDNNNFPKDFDSTYQYIGRTEKKVREGTGEAKITDFSLVSLSGTDTTQAIFNQRNRYILVFVKDFTDASEWKNEKFTTVLDELRIRNVDFLFVTADADGAKKWFNNWSRILKCDVTVIKTAARVTPTFFVMQGANVLGKYSYADADEVYDQMDTTK